MSKKEKNYSYRNEKWLFNQYIELEKSIRQISKICTVSFNAIRYWLIKFNIKIRTNSESNKIMQNKPEVKKKHSESMKGKKKSEEHKRKIGESMKKQHKKYPEKWKRSEEFKNQQSERMKGDKNPNWRGGSSKYKIIHRNIRKRKIETGICNICKKPEFYNGLGKLELSNITGKLIDNVDNFQWAHHKCHKNWDIKNKIFHEGLPSKPLKLTKISLITINQDTLFKLRVVRFKLEKKLEQDLNWKGFFEEIIKIIHNVVKFQ